MTLTHDFSSPVFEKQGEMYLDKKRLNFDAKRPIKRILASVGGAINYEVIHNPDAIRPYHVSGLKFMDKKGTKLGFYNDKACIF